MNTESTQTPESLGSPLCSVLDDVPFPTSEEAKEILAREGIDMTDLRAKVMRRLCDIKGHNWKLSWPLDPCEYTCERCGEQVLH
jgi:hypothetical protein